MPRFLSVHWDPQTGSPKDELSLVKSRVGQFLPSWRRVLEGDGICIFCAEDALEGRDILRIEGNGGAVIGTVFRKASTWESSARVGHFSGKEAREIASTQGRSLVSNFWGSYVAFLYGAGRSSCVLRGPMSAVKCLQSNYRGLCIFFSRIDDFSSLQLGTLSINWDCIRAQAACMDYVTQETAINEVRSLEGGECALVRRGKVVSNQFFWHPCRIANEPAITDFEEAAHLTRTATELCVASWASYFDTIVLRLSGGIDSSIVASCARQVLARERMPCINYFTSNVTGDERRYARDVARKMDLALTERERERRVDLNIFLACARTPRPILDFSGYGQYRLEVEFARTNGARAIFCGELGDNLFDHNGGVESTADYVWRHGIRFGLLQVAIDHAVRRNFSVWESLRRGLRGRRHKVSKSTWNADTYAEREFGLRLSDVALLQRQALQSVRDARGRFSHPWLVDTVGTPPAKFATIYGMLVWSAYEPPFAAPSDPPVIAPLASQPLGEIALRIPSYLANRGGLGRAVVRHSFASELPSSVLLRTTKGTPEPWTRDVVRQNQSFLKEFLLDGILVKEQILDPKRVELLLSNEFAASNVVIGDLIVQLYIEAWLRRWSVNSSQLAA